jgi:hypothetical protein
MSILWKVPPRIKPGRALSLFRMLRMLRMFRMFRLGWVWAADRAVVQATLLVRDRVVVQDAAGVTVMVAGGTVVIFAAV